MTSEMEARKLVDAVAHWHHTFEVFPGIITSGSYDPRFLWDKLYLPKDLKGSRVLDIGASDGFFSLNVARLGADVVAIDYREKEEHGFWVTEALNDVSIDYKVMNIYEIGPKDLGVFDIILFLGVLYHLPDMIRALHLIRQCCRGSIFLETHSDNSICTDVAVARYFRAGTLADDYTNFWSPNRLCVIDMLSDCGFDVTRDETWGDRMFCEATVSVGSLDSQEKMDLGYGKGASTRS